MLFSCMSMKSYEPKISAAQKEALVQFMEEHPELHQGKFVGLLGRNRREFLWQELRNILNSAEGPQKSIYKWQRVWVDLKNKVKRKSRGLLSRSTVGKPLRYLGLTPVEHRLLTLLTKKTVDDIGDRDMTLDAGEVDPLPTVSTSDSKTQLLSILLPQPTTLQISGADSDESAEEKPCVLYQVSAIPTDEAETSQASNEAPVTSPKDRWRPAEYAKNSTATENQQVLDQFLTIAMENRENISLLLTEVRTMRQEMKSMTEAMLHRNSLLAELINKM